MIATQPDAERAVPLSATSLFVTRPRSGAPPRLRARVERDLGRITGAVVDVCGRGLQALLLVGGYARGEGGALGEGPEAAPYNDYDLVAVGRLDAARRAALQRVAHALTGETGVDVDVLVLSPRVLERPPPTLFWLDVSLGGVRVLHGDARRLAAAQRLRPRDIPFEEGARLLANRATGLAITRLEGPSRDPRTAARHVYKAVLACGDAVLLAADRYGGSTAERQLSLRALAAASLVEPALCEAFDEAARFRARPDTFCPAEDMDAWFAAWCRKIERWHLAFESARLGEPLDACRYAERRAPIFARRPDGFAFGVPAALRAALRGKVALRPYRGHPREKLARVACALAYLPMRAAEEVAEDLLGLGPGRATRVAMLDGLLRLRDVGS